MSVHQESLDMAKPMERAQDPPELEYNTYRHDSLSMFGAAIGGAVLGMLLTLLILAIINGGTLSFSGGERLAVMEASMTHRRKCGRVAPTSKWWPNRLRICRPNCWA